MSQEQKPQTLNPCRVCRGVPIAYLKAYSGDELTVHIAHLDENGSYYDSLCQNKEYVHSKKKVLTPMQINDLFLRAYREWNEKNPPIELNDTRQVIDCELAAFTKHYSSRSKIYLKKTVATILIPEKEISFFKQKLERVMPQLVRSRFIIKALAFYECRFSRHQTKFIV